MKIGNDTNSSRGYLCANATHDFDAGFEYCCSDILRVWIQFSLEVLCAARARLVLRDSGQTELSRIWSALRRHGSLSKLFD